ncbi:MAG: hypothetical protein JWO86_4064, partial [Myxococcaceae bacterium]|nr:hypothetical protein [Myxococcaceae bacterium]
MTFGKKIRLVFAAAAISTATMACGVPEAPPQASRATSGTTYHVTASKLTEKKTGVKRWHTIVEHGSHAMVVDGVDAKGNVKFVTSIQVDQKKHTVTLVSYAKGQQGTLVMDLRTGNFLSNTIPQKSFVLFARAFGADALYHNRLQTQYASWWSIGLAAVGAAVVVVAAVATAPVWLPVAGAGLAAAGIGTAA